MIVGIDLGTTNSLAAVWKDGKAELIPNVLGLFLTPSVISINDDETVIVGQAAKDRLVSHPNRTASAFKRFMGSKKEYMLAKHKFTPEELSALVLKSLKADAESYLGQPVQNVVITVPAYFNDIQRNATKQAAELAQLNVLRLLNEPTAAAMAYGLHQLEQDSKFLVLDLGGGTFDVTLLELFVGVMEVRSSAGDNSLGGEDFTLELVKGFIDHHKKTGVEESFWDSHLEKIHSAAESTKRNLSSMVEDTATISVVIGEDTYDWDITKQQFASLSSHLLERIRRPIEKAIRDARLRVSDLDDIVLVGGSTRMPIFRQLIVQMFGRFPSTGLNPDESICLGAAIQAGLIAQDAALDEVVLTDVAPYSLGVDSSIEIGKNQYQHGQFSPIIERNTIIPSSRVHTFYALNDQQKHVEFSIFQGESRLVKDNVFLGKTQVKLPKGKKATEWPIEIRFSYDTNGLLEVDIEVKDSEVRAQLTIQNDTAGLTPKQIKASHRKLALLKIHPRELAVNQALLSKAERLYVQLLGQEREIIRSQIAYFESVLNSQDERAIREASKDFRNSLDELDKEIF